MLIIAHLQSGQALNHLFGAQPFNYTDALDALPNAIHAFGGKTAINGDNGFINASGRLDDPFANPDVDALTSTASFNAKDSGVSDAAFVLSESALDMHCWGKSSLLLNYN